MFCKSNFRKETLLHVFRLNSTKYYNASVAQVLITATCRCFELGVTVRPLSPSIAYSLRRHCSPKINFLTNKESLDVYALDYIYIFASLLEPWRVKVPLLRTRCWITRIYQLVMEVASLSWHSWLQFLFQLYLVDSDVIISFITERFHRMGPPLNVTKLIQHFLLNQSLP